MQRILIIEDEQAIRKQIAQVLRFEGFDALEADNGSSGVTSAISLVPDLIICDIMMPALDGFGVLQTLRSNPQTAMIPFIFLTALVASDNLRHGMDEGADDYITKPFQPAVLIGSVRRRLEKRNRQIEESRQRAEEVSLAVAATVPHEILETLDHIMTVTNLMALKYAAQDPQIEAMQQSVAEESTRLRRMMRRLHLYSQLPQLYANRFEQGKTGMTATAGRVLNLTAREVGRRWNRAADLVIHSDSMELPMGEEYLSLLVEELVDNACKFSAPGTAIKLLGQAQRGFWSLAVSNRGTGMSAEQIAHIGAFKQFLSGNKKPRGLGLGLALTQGISRLHGCEFEIQTDPGGITVTILVPLEGGKANE
jgi:DNA-binding response OmpR family regulator